MHLVHAHAAQQSLSITARSSHPFDLYFSVADVDSLYAEFSGKGAPISSEIGDRPYGMRDFSIIDPDGYVLAFGQGVH